jgi:structure-specific recognition protein 1
MTTVLPLKNKSGYLHYCSDVRPTIQKAFPDIKSVDIVKKQGDGWKSLSAEDKQKYEEKAKVDKERYLKEKDEWALKNPGVVIEKKVKVKRAKKAVANPAEEEEIVILDEELVQEEAPVAPVVVAPVVEEAVKEKKARAPNKFQNFCKAYRPKLKVEKPKLQPKEVLTELGALWKALSPEEQEKYV